MVDGRNPHMLPDGPRQIVIGSSGLDSLEFGKCLVFVDSNIAQAFEGRPGYSLFDEDRNGLVRIPPAGEGESRLLETMAVIREFRGNNIVIVGGGSIIDEVMLARALATSGDPLFLLERSWGTRGGLVTVDSGIKVKGPVFAVPTTFGTGAEVSDVACWTLNGVHRLYQGPALSPEFACYDTELLLSLSERQVFLGAWEISFRILAAYCEGRSVLPMSDACSRMLLAEVGRFLGSGSDWASDRRSLGQLQWWSRESHLGPAMRGRGRYPSTLWYLANTLSSVWSVPKLVAHFALLPTYLGAMLQNVPFAQRWEEAMEAFGYDAFLDCFVGFGNLNALRYNSYCAHYDLLNCLPPTREADPDALMDYFIRTWGRVPSRPGGLSRFEVYEVFAAACAGQFGAKLS